MLLPLYQQIGPLGVGRRPSLNLLDSLVGYWKLDETTGTRVDATGRGNDLADNNTVTSAAGKVNNASQHVAASVEYLSKASVADLQMGDFDFTFAGWFYLDSVTAIRAIFGKTDGVQIEYQMFCNVTTGAAFFDYFGNGASNTLVRVTSGTTINLATWYFLEAYHDAANNLLGIRINNGSATTQATGGVAPNTSNGGFTLGSRSGGSLPFDGRLDEWGIWKRLLTSAERTTLYNGGSGVTYPFS